MYYCIAFLPHSDSCVYVMKGLNSFIGINFMNLDYKTEVCKHMLLDNTRMYPAIIRCDTREEMEKKIVSFLTKLKKTYSIDENNHYLTNDGYEYIIGTKEELTATVVIKWGRWKLERELV